MKNLWLTLLLVLAAGVVSFGALYAISDRPEVRRAAREHDAMAWLRAEFQLGDADFARIAALHENYGKVCARHCAAIMAARERHAPAAEQVRLEQVCVESMTEHFRKVAALMPPGQGERYLAIVLPRVGNYGHERVPTLQVQP